MTVLLVSLGGIVGVVCRYTLLSYLPLASFGVILMINAVGSFIIGWCFKDIGGIYLWPLIAIGFCGAFTTFSTYSLDTIRFFMDDQIWMGVGYVLVSNGVAIGMCALGVVLRKVLLSV
jgi:fluoride exporter